MRPQSGDVYRADIPPQYRPGTVLYHILANDRWGNEVRDPSSGDYQVQVHSISEPIGGGPAGKGAHPVGVLLGGPPRGFWAPLFGGPGGLGGEGLDRGLPPPQKFQNPLVPRAPPGPPWV